MVFHGHTVDVECAYHAIALEYAKMDLKECEEEWERSHTSVGPQMRIDAMRDAYFEAYGHLCSSSENYLQELLKHDCPDI